MVGKHKFHVMNVKNDATKHSKELAKKIKASKKEIDTLNLPTPTYFAVHIGNGYFDAVELDQYRRVYVYEKVEQDLEKWLITFQKSKHRKIVAIGLGKRHKHSNLTSNLWLKHDIVPHIIQQESHHSIEELIESARLTTSLFEPDLSVHPLIDDFNRVIPSYLVSKKDYQKTVNPVVWQKLEQLSAQFEGKKLRFFSATPQGGGVALMRHALKRLFRLVGVDMTWHVLYDDPEIFKITKTKFHNVLQNVCPPGTRLSDEEMTQFKAWSKRNAESFRPKLKKSDVIVIDDPQPVGLVPYIKEWNPQAKVFYRSHIQIEAQLAADPQTSQWRTWQFIHQLIKPIDAFISHPIKEFVPVDINPAVTMSMPATTDPLDGLNKPLSQEQEQFYLSLFNKHLLEDGQTPLDIRRDYLIQIARFDPSKGIPDLLEAYWKVCQKIPIAKRPQLVIVGHGSVDDPDGIPMLNYTHEELQKPKFKHIVSDIKVARLPHIDQPLNVLLRNAKLALQLSHKEGFEVKVTEALMKGVPVVAYNTGGIPLQISDDGNGLLIDRGDIDAVAQTLVELLTEPKHYRKLTLEAKQGDYTKYQTVMNGIRWLYIATQCLQGHKDFGHGQSVDDLMGLFHR